jgi:ABC-type nitrate/sulfonate/bicarbonate transport system permease component
MAKHDVQNPVADVRSVSKAVQDAEMIAAGATVPALNTHHIHILSVCGFVALWIVLAQTLPSDVLPGPLPVLGALWDNVASGDLRRNAPSTKSETALDDELLY